MLSGSMPFSDEDQGQLYARIQKGIFSFPDNLVDHVSQEARDLIIRLLTVDPKKRFTVHQALEHTWMRQEINEVPTTTTTTVITSDTKVDVKLVSSDLFEIQGH
jgi:serine/threonine protein kinase